MKECSSGCSLSSKKNAKNLFLVMFVLSILFLALSVSSVTAVVTGGSFTVGLNNCADFSAGASTAVTSDCDINFTGSQLAAICMPDSVSTTDYLFTAIKAGSKIKGIGPNLDLNSVPKVPDSNFVDPYCSNCGYGTNFPICQSGDGLAYYNGSHYIAFIVGVGASGSQSVSITYKINSDEGDNTINGVSSTGCGSNTEPTSCAAAGKCYWDYGMVACLDDAASTGGGGTEDVGAGTGNKIECFEFSGMQQMCDQVNTCTWNTITLSCDNNAGSFNSTTGITCSNIVSQDECQNIPKLDVCCSWNDNACATNYTRKDCKTFGREAGDGNTMITCENAGANATLCTKYATAYFLPCTFDNYSSTARNPSYNGVPKCVPMMTGIFGDQGFGNFMDISSQSNCEATGGNWISESYTYTDNYGRTTVKTDEWCEMGFGGSFEDCDDACWACEDEAWNDGTPWSAGNAQARCSNSSLGFCTWVLDPNSWNGLGFCNMKDDIQYMGGNCQDSCNGCWDNESCATSTANCTYTFDPLNMDYNNDGTVDGWCSSKTFDNYNNCDNNCMSCFGETGCQASALNTGEINCTWVDEYENATLAEQLNLTNPFFDFVGCVRTTSDMSSILNEICFVPGDEDGNGQSDCEDTACSMAPECGYGMGGGYSGGTVGPAAGEGTYTGPGTGGGDMGFGVDCASQDSMMGGTLAACEAMGGSGKCFWHIMPNGEGLCDPVFMKNMKGGMMMDTPPVPLGSDADGDAGGQDWLDIKEVGIHADPIGGKIDIGIPVKNITHFVGCNAVYPTQSLNYTGKYYRYIDIDNNASSGCNATRISGGEVVMDQSGYEFLVSYTNNGTLESKLLYRCINSTTHRWGLKSGATISTFSEPCYSDEFMQIMGFAGVQVVVLNKADMGNWKNTIGLFVATANETTNKTYPVDSAGPFYYTPGAVDFKMEDCSAPGQDLDGDGFKSESDPDCQKFKQYGYVPVEGPGPKCNDGIDNDGNTFTDCNDPTCKYDPFFCPGTGFGSDENDKTAPTITWNNKETYTDSAFIKLSTNEPTNASIEFYYTGSSCLTSQKNKTIVHFGALSPFPLDDFKIWHDIPLDNYPMNEQRLGFNLNNGTSYFYKVRTCDSSANCAVSACLNFTTRATTSSSDCPNCNFVFGFKFSPPSWSPNPTDPVGNMTFSFDYGGDGSWDIENDPLTFGKSLNNTKAVNTSIKFTNPTSTTPWSIVLKGIDIKSAATSAFSNVSASFIVNTSNEGESMVGMDSGKFMAMAQSLSPKSFEITIPTEGDTLNYCQESNHSNCQDLTSNATKISQGGGQSTWSLPIGTGIGFSLYKVDGGVTVISDKSSYQCNPTCEAIINITNSNATLKNKLYNWTFTNVESGGAAVSFGLWTHDGTNYVYNGSAEAISLTSYNFSSVTKTFKLNLTVDNFTAGGKWTLFFNATEYDGNWTMANYSTTIVPYIDIINLTNPATSASLSGATQWFNWTMFSELNGIATDNQSCTLYVDAVAQGTLIAANATATGLQNNASISEGEHNWNVSCRNNESEIGWSATRGLTLSTAPTVNIEYPVSTTITNDNTTTIMFNITDDTAVNESSIVIEIQNYTYSNITIANSSAQTVCSIIGSTGNNLSCNVTLNSTQELADATWTLNITAKDSSGNADSSNVNFIVDVNVPVVNNVWISDRYIDSSEVVNVSVQVTDSGSDIYNVSVKTSSTTETALIRTGGTNWWNGTVTFIESAGIVNVTITVFDNATNSKSNITTITVDTTAPNITVILPANGTTVANPVLFNFTVEDAQLFNTSILIETNHYLNDTVLPNGTVNVYATLQAGTYTATYYAMDNASNAATTRVRTFTVNAQENLTQLVLDINDTFAGQGAPVTDLSFVDSAGEALTDNNFLNQTITLKYVANVSQAATNVTSEIKTPSGLNLNINKTTQVGVTVSTAAALARTIANAAAGRGALDAVMFFQNVSNLIQDAHYNVTLNFSSMELGNRKALYLADDTGNDVRVLKQCTTNAVPGSVEADSDACYTNGTGWTTLYLPHLSGGALEDPVDPPQINFTEPTDDGGQEIVPNSYLVLRGSIYDLNLNTSSCIYNLTNATNLQLETGSFTPTAVNTNATNYTFSYQTSQMLTNGTGYNVSVTCNSENPYNSTTRNMNFVVADTTVPRITAITAAGASSTTTTGTLTVTWTTDEPAYCGYNASSLTQNLTTHTYALTNMTRSNNNKTHTYSVGYSADGSAVIPTVICRDVYNNNMVLSNATSAVAVDITEETTTTTTTSGSNSLATSTKTATSETTKFIIMNPNTENNMKVRNEALGVTSIGVVVNKQLRNVELKISTVDTPESPISEGTGSSYKYFELTSSQVTNDDIEKIRIKFKVEKSWLASNNYKNDEVLLVRFKDDVWNDLQTTMLSSDSTYVYYEAETPGFSTFVIVGRTTVEAKAAAEEAEKIQAEKEAVKEEPPAEAEEKEEAAPVIPTQPAKKGYGWIVLVVVVVLGVIAYFVYQKKRG